MIAAPITDELRSQISAGRQLALMALMESVQDVPGDACEIGVYRGGTGWQMCRTMPYRTVYLFDTFTGMPEPDPSIDAHQKGDFGDTSLESVRNYLRDCPNVAIRPGHFPETTEGLQGKRFAFAHIDCDLYASTRDAITFVWPRLNVGGVLAFDDYKSPQCRGATKAIDEFAEREGVTLEGNAPREAVIARKVWQAHEG